MSTLRIKPRLVTATVATVAAFLCATAQFVPNAGADETFGEYTVGGRILEAYTATGGSEKWGTPTMNEAAAADRGRFQRFEKTSFYWNASVSNGVAHQIGGAILVRWGSYKFERGPLKFPVTDEVDAAGKGRKQFFQGGNVYYGGRTGTHVVWGGILGKYAAADGPGGKFGLPVGDEYRVGRQYAQSFEGGLITWP